MKGFYELKNGDNLFFINLLFFLLSVTILERDYCYGNGRKAAGNNWVTQKANSKSLNANFLRV